MPRFKSGNSGNPKGRPKGKETHGTQVRQLLQMRSVEITNKVIELALDGDIPALKLCLERICAPLKTHEEAIMLELKDASNLSTITYSDALLSALINGKIAPGQAASAITVLTQHAKLLEVTELQQRIEKLEETLRRNNDLNEC